MTICRSASIDFKQDLTLKQWHVFQSKSGGGFLAGHCIETGKSALSDALVLFDRNSLKALSANGCVYRLDGAPGADADSLHEWKLQALILDIGNLRDATETVMADASGAR